MTDKAYRPKMVVKLRLTMHWQNKLLSLLAKHLAIMESYPEDHVVYMPERMFTRFLFAAHANDIQFTLKQLNAEYVDMRKEPQITVVREFGNYSELSQEAKD